MPVRTRAGSSPIRSLSIKDGPQVLVTSPSKRSVDGRFRRGSLSTVEAVKQRARGNTATSSDLSSENELDPSVFRRRQINPPRATRNSNLLQQQHVESDVKPLRDVKEDQGEDSEESDETSLSSEFAETADSESLLDGVPNPLTSHLVPHLPPGMSINPPSPRRTRNGTTTNTLQALPPPRPISTIIPVSALGQAIRAQRAKPKNPVDFFARLSGKGALNPVNIRIYAPFSKLPDKPFEMPLQRTVPNDSTGEDLSVTVADTVGLALWRYHEEGLSPPVASHKLDVNRWTFRIVDDGEVDHDFPPLNRTGKITDFTSNNNRGGRGRSRAKAYDEFALVEATEAQFKENQIQTPQYTQQFEEFSQEPIDTITPLPAPTELEAPLSEISPLTTTINKPFAFTARKQSATLADRPDIPTVHSTPRIGPPKVLKIHFTSVEAYRQTSTIEITTDTYFAEVLDTVCRKWNLDKAHHFLKVTGTNTVAPLDRTIESIGIRTDLDLIRRRFAYDGGLGLAGSPGSSSPNAPLLLTTNTPLKKSKKPLPPSSLAHPLSQKQDLWTQTSNYNKKYAVVRKQPMSFTPSHQRTLLIDGDCLHILPGETGKTMFDNNRSTTVPFSMIVGCKISRRHPKTFRVVVYRDRETKRYDFEAQSAEEAGEIAEEIQKGMEPFRTGLEGGFS